MITPTDSPTSDSPTEQSLLSYFRQNGVDWGAADLFLLGARGAAHRIAEFIAILLAMREKSGGPIFKSICIAMPPGSTTANLQEKVKKAFPEAVGRLRGTPATETEVTAALAKVRFDCSASMDVAALTHLVAQTEDRSAIVLTQAARYRADGVSSRREELSLPDDTWAPHLHALVGAVGAAAANARKYIVVDAGEFIPARKENLDLVVACEWGVTGANDPDDSPLEVLEQARRWHALAREGRLGTVVGEINAIKGLSQVSKDLIRLHTFLQLGLALQVRDELETRPELTSDLDASSALRVAMLAEEADAETQAIELLTGAADGLEVQEDIENALQLAERLKQRHLTEVLFGRLGRLFPNSPGLRRHRVSLCLSERNYAAVANLFAGSVSAEDIETHEYYKLVAAILLEHEAFDVRAALDELSKKHPSRTKQSLRVCAFHLEAIGRRGEALRTLAAASENRPDVDKRALGLALDMLERGRLVLDAQVDDGLVVHIVEWLARELAQLPDDGFLRLRLARLVSPEVLGSTGLPAIATVVLSLFSRPVQPRSVIPLDQRAAACSLDETRELFERGAKWLATERPIVLGARRFPPELLNVPAEQAVAGLSRMIEHMGHRLEDDGDFQTMEAILGLAVSIAPLSSDPNEDLSVLRLAAASLAMSGRVQRARDLVEQGLMFAGEDPQRRRIAWHTFADVYARLGNFTEALIAMACCAVADDRPDWQQVWAESLVLLRIFRDMGMVELGRPLIGPARKALHELRAQPRYFARMETVELQMRLLDFEHNEDVPNSDLAKFVTEATTNVRKILELQDEIEPAASLLANAFRLAAERGVGVDDQNHPVLVWALKESSPTFRSLIEVTSAPNPSVQQLLPLVRRLESARYPEDIGFDVRALAFVAEKILGSGAALTPGDASYAIELLTDQAIALPSRAGASQFLGVERASPASAAIEISKLGIDIIMIGNGTAGLVRTVAAEGNLSGPYVEETSVFSRQRLSKWSSHYPYGYKQVDDVNEFYLSTSGIGISEMPTRAVLIAGTDLQAFPPNLLNVANDLAGRTRRLAAAPSLAWLKSAITKPMPSDGRVTAWIPDAEPKVGLATLAVIAERLRDSFQNHGVSLTGGSAPPSGLAGSEMAIVAAHGGLTEDARYFRAVADDVDLAIATSTLSGALAEIGVVVLFVCSGGRLDKHPGASTTVGLVKKLLDSGCSAVVAPPWPLNVSVPPHWLPNFLTSWTAGQCVIDACFEANQAVRRSLGEDPSKYLAMSVYGNPLARKPRSGTGKGLPVR